MMPFPFKSYSQATPSSLLILCPEVITMARAGSGWGALCDITNNPALPGPLSPGARAHQPTVSHVLCHLCSPCSLWNGACSCLCVSPAAMPLCFLLWERNPKKPRGRCPAEGTLEFGRIYQSIPKAGLGASGSGSLLLLCCTWYWSFEEMVKRIR